MNAMRKIGSLRIFTFLYVFGIIADSVKQVYLLGW